MSRRSAPRRVYTTTNRNGPTKRTRALPFVIAGLVLVLTFLSGCNPFAPAVDEGDPFGDLLGDPNEISGFFTNFRNAYELRDISLYEPLLDSAFVFVYRDPDEQIERQWGFPQDLESTRRLFENADLIRLQWNQIISQDTLAEGLQQRVVRSFNLTISLATGEAFVGGGNVNFLLKRREDPGEWQLLRWRDESEF